MDNYCHFCQEIYELVIFCENKVSRDLKNASRIIKPANKKASVNHYNVQVQVQYYKASTGTQPMLRN